MSENVLVVENKLLRPYLNGRTGSLITKDRDTIYSLLLNNHSFMKRDLAEYNFDHKQIIPYVTIRYKRDYLLLQRTSKQTEKRLHNKYSLGIGGHINPNSSSEHNVIVNGLYKELNEEISLTETADLNFIGIINDESNSVSRVHLGLLYSLEVLSPDFRIEEAEKMSARWVTIREMEDYYEYFETWSQIVYDQYIIKGFKDSRGQGVQ